MPLRLFTLEDHPNRVAVSDVDSFVPDRAFFLDFSRRLESRRRFGVTLGLFVPVIHEGESNGGYVVGVERNDPRFEEPRALWKAHYPSTQPSLKSAADGFKIVADFATQFPAHCQ